MIEDIRFKKILVLGLVNLLIVSGFGIAIGSSRSVSSGLDNNETYSPNVSFAGGNGTEDDPYQISNVTQLQKMNEDLDVHYELINDIDASVTENWNDGSGFMPVGKDNNNKFTGSLDGKGYNVSELWIDRLGADYVGLFGYLGETASVEDIGLVDANVNGYKYVGGLVGRSYGGTIINSSATVDVSGYQYVGGLVGWTSGTIRNSYVTGDVSGYWFVGGLVGKNEYSTFDGIVSNSYVTGDVNGNKYVGGLVGWNTGTVSKSYVTGDVSGNKSVSGLVGKNNNGMVSNSYATGNVSGNKYVGGLIGENDGDKVENSLWNVNTTGQSSSDGGTGKTTAEMKDIDTFTDESTVGLQRAWDFAGDPNDDTGSQYVWYIDENGTINNGYPYLTWSQDDKQDTIPPTSTASADKTTVSIGEGISFDASRSCDNAGIDSYSWEFGDGSTGSGETITYSYDSPGEYTVTLTVTDSAGNQNTDTLTITVEDHSKPTAVASADKATVSIGESVSFDAFNSSDNAGIDSYSWEFGDGSTGSGETITYSYESLGEYTVTLRVKDSAGNEDTDTVNITIEDQTKPTAVASADKMTVSIGESINFDASDSSDNIGIDSYSWQFGDGSKGSGEATTHSYTSAGNYTVTLTVEDEAGNSAEDTIEITVEKSGNNQDDDDGGDGIPGFTTLALLISLSFVVLYRYRKKRT